MDFGQLIGEIGRQFSDVKSPFGLAKAIALFLILLLALGRGFRVRRDPAGGLGGWDAIVVGMLTNILSFNLMMPVFGALGGTLQNRLGVDLTAPTLFSRAMSVTVLMLILVSIASLALGLVLLLRGLGAAIGRPAGDAGEGTGTAADGDALAG